MTEQKIEPCEFVAGLCSHCGASERLGCEGWIAPSDRVQSLADQVDALTKERDALAAARYAYASEFSIDEEGHPDVGSIHQNIRALKAAAKLALDALHAVLHDCDDIDMVESNEPGRDVGPWQLSNDAITALRQAGVQ